MSRTGILLCPSHQQRAGACWGFGLGYSQTLKLENMLFANIIVVITEPQSSLLPLDPAVLQRLLDSIEARNLVLLCGAGLSIPEPSKLMSAVSISRACYDQYAPTQLLPAPLRDDVDQLAGHFLQNGQFEPLFID